MSTTENAGHAHCIRCHRALRSAASRRRGSGAWCAAKMRAAALAGAVKGFAEAQVEKAREAIADGALVAIRAGVYQVVSSKGDATYFSHADVCNCPAGLHGRRCWHLAAVRIITAGKTA